MMIPTAWKRPLAGFGVVAVFLVSFGALLPGAAPHLAAGAAARNALVGTSLGVSEPPGSPGFALASRVVGGAVGAGNAAYRQNAAAALFVSMGLAALAILLMRVTGRRWGSLLALVLLFSPALRYAARTSTPEALAFFCVALILLATQSLVKRRGGAVALAFAAGVFSGVHPALLPVLPAALVFWWRHRSPAARIPWIHFVLALAAGVSIYLFIPIRAAGEPLVLWPGTSAASPVRWLRDWLASGSESPLSLAGIAAALSETRRFFVENLGWAGCFLAVLGSVNSLPRTHHRRVMLTCWAMIAVTAPAVIWFSGATARAPGVAVVALLPAAVLIALALAPLWTSRILLYRVSFAAFLVAIAVEGRFASGGIPDRLRWDASIREGAQNLLRTAPAGAVLIADRRDESEPAIAFLTGIEGGRPDLRFIDSAAIVTPNIYGEAFPSASGGERRELRESVENALVKASTTPVVYATLDPAGIDVYRTSRGLLYRAWPLSREPKPVAFPWHRVVSWRHDPVEPGAQAFFRANLTLLGRALFEAGFRDGAGMMFGRAERHGGRSRWEEMAYWAQVRSDVASADRYYARAAKAGVESVTFFENLGALQMERRRVGDAAETYARGLARYPNATRLLYGLARARLKTGADEDARRLLRRLLTIEPWNVDADRLLSQASNGKRN